MKCPRCGILSPREAQRCDCGYDFVAKEVRTPFLAVRDEERSQGLGAFATLGLAFCLAVFASVGACALFLAPWVWRGHSKTVETVGPADPAPKVRDLAKLLKEEDPDMRLEAIEELAWMGRPAVEAVPALVEALADKNRHVRAKAAWALGNLGPPARSATTPLLKTLKDEDPAVRVEAANALWRVGHDPEAGVPTLVEALQNEQLRNRAAWALGEIGPPAKAAVPALRQALKDRAIAKDAGAALKKIDPEAAKAAGVP